MWLVPFGGACCVVVVGFVVDSVPRSVQLVLGRISFGNESHHPFGCWVVVAVVVFAASEIASYQSSLVLVFVLNLSPTGQ